MKNFVTVEVASLYLDSTTRQDRVHIQEVRSLNADHVLYLRPNRGGVRVVDGEPIHVATTTVALTNGEMIVVIGAHSRLFYEFRGVEE